MQVGELVRVKGAEDGTSLGNLMALITHKHGYLWVRTGDYNSNVSRTGGYYRAVATGYERTFYDDLMETYDADR